MTRAQRLTRTAIYAATAWAVVVALGQPDLNGHSLLAVFLVFWSTIATIGSSHEPRVPRT